MKFDRSRLRSRRCLRSKISPLSAALQRHRNTAWSCKKGECNRVNIPRLNRGESSGCVMSNALTFAVPEVTYVITSEHPFARASSHPVSPRGALTAPKSKFARLSTAIRASERIAHSRTRIYRVPRRRRVSRALRRIVPVR